MTRSSRCKFFACGLAVVVALFAAWSAWPQATETDPIFAGDFVDPATGEVVELQPGAPWIQPGPDGDFGDEDDVVDFSHLGDVDLVIRAGRLGFEGPIPATSPLIGDIPVTVAEPFGEGVPVEFVVVPSNGMTPPDAGQPILSPLLEGAPVLVIAFADLDGDGFIGVTHLDGDFTDDAVEAREVDPVGRQFAFFQDGQAAGKLRIAVGSPRENLRIALTAVAYVGLTRDDFFGGVVPDGPAVMTRLPTFPRTDPDRVIDGNLPPAADPDSPIGVEIEDEFTPDPAAPYGETFTLPTDGSDPSVDIAIALSGSVSHFGFARRVTPALFDDDLGGPLRLGLDEAGRLSLLEILDPFALDGGGAALLRLVPLDRLGNIAALAVARQVAIVAGGGLAIVSPDLDGDPSQEVIQVSGPEGAVVQISGAGSLMAEVVPEPGSALLGLVALAVVTGIARARRAVGGRSAHRVHAQRMGLAAAR